MYIVIVAIVTIVGVVVWGCYMIGFRSTGRHSDTPIIPDDAPRIFIGGSMQLEHDKGWPFYHPIAEYVSAYPEDYLPEDDAPWNIVKGIRLVDDRYTESTRDRINKFYDMAEGIADIAVPAGW